MRKLIYIIAFLALSMVSYGQTMKVFQGETYMVNKSGNITWMRCLSGSYPTQVIPTGKDIIFYSGPSQPSVGEIISSGITGSGESLPEIPLFTDALFWLDGTISDTLFMDQSGNGRNFSISNKDFTTNYLPYKSAATISAPIGDTILFQNDINRFLYATDSTPNQIPVVSFFQNIDYENKLFTRHVSQDTSATGAETTEPHIKDIVLYDAVLSGGNLTTANTYYGVPIESTTGVFWVAKGGSDAAAGSKAAPWLTLNWASDHMATGDTVYVKTGLYDETTDLDLAYAGLTKTYFGIGGVKVTSTGTALTVEAKNGLHIFHGMVFDGRGVTATTFGGNAYQRGVELYRCKIVGGTTQDNSSGQFGDVLVNCVLPYAEINLGYLGGLRGCYIKRLEVTAVNNYANTYEIKYNKFIEPGEPNIYAVSGSSTSMTLDIKHNTFYNKDIALNIAASAMTSLKIERNSFYSVAGGTSFRPIVIQSGVTTGDKCVPSIKYNYFEANHNSTVMISVNANSLNNPEVMYNTFVENGGTTTSWRAISFSTALNTGAYKANYNTIIINNAQAGYGIESGETGGTKFVGAEIVGNYIRGHLYNHPEETAGGLHGIAASRGTDIKVAYNRVEYVPLGIVVKGGAVGYTANGVYGNVCYECQAGFYLRQCNGIKFYNNTFVNYAVQSLRFGAVDDEDGATSDSVVIQNNIFHSTLHAAGNPQFFVDDAVLTRDGVMFDNNIYNPPTAKEAEFITDDVVTPNSYTLAEATTNGWAVNGTIETVTFTGLSTGVLTLATGSNGIGDGSTLDAAYDDNLDPSTDWGDVNTLPIIVTRQQTVPWDKGAYVKE